MRYLIGFLIVVGLIVLVFVLIFKSFSGSGGAPSTSKPLIDYANTNTIVEMTIDGPINADQSHYELQMTVGASQSQLNLLRGYQSTLAKTHVYENNPSSYAEFLRALDLAGYSKGDTSKTADSDPRGYCAAGERYTFEILNGGQDVERFWATSCGGLGTFKGSTTAVKNLFRAQMPDYESIISGTNVF